MNTPYKLGRIKTAHDPRTLMISRYLPAPAPPSSQDYHQAVEDSGVEWGMFDNDEIGDCVAAAPAHHEMVWTAQRGHLFIPSNAAVVQTYRDVGGFDPANPGSTDNGMDPLSYLKYWKKTGLDGHPIAAYGAVHSGDIQRVKQVIHLFRGCYIALALPMTMDGKYDWDIPAGQSATGEWSPGSLGGHMVMSAKYDSYWVYYVSWGRIVRASWRFHATYSDECFAVVSPDMLDMTSGLTPEGADLPRLIADAQELTA